MLKCGKEVGMVHIICGLKWRIWKECSKIGSRFANIDGDWRKTRGKRGDSNELAEIGGYILIKNNHIVVAQCNSKGGQI
jgi:hypothetical protein